MEALKGVFIMKIKKKPIYCYVQKKEPNYPFIVEIFNFNTQKYEVVACYHTLYEAECCIDNYLRFFGNSTFRILKNLGVFGGN